MQTTVGGRQTDDLAAGLKGSTAIETGEAEDTGQLVVAIIHGGFVETTRELAQRPVAAVGPRTTGEFDVIVEGSCARIVGVAQPCLSIVVTPANPGSFQADHLDAEHTVRNGVNPTVRVAGGGRTHDGVLGFLPCGTAVARAHHFLHGDEENATAGGDADAGLFARFTNVAELEGHLHREHVDRFSIAVGDKDSGRDLFFFDRWRSHGFFTETS